MVTATASVATMVAIAQTEARLEPIAITPSGVPMSRAPRALLTSVAKTMNHQNSGRVAHRSNSAYLRNTVLIVLPNGIVGCAALTGL